MQASNLHAMRPRLLRPLRLPVPPIGRLLFGVRGRDRTDDHRVHIPERFHCATRTIEIGLRGEVRTPDPMLPKHVRYQLRYAEK